MTISDHTTPVHTTVAVVGGGVVGTAIAHTLSHRGVDVVLLEADSDLGYAASGTNSGILHTGFDSTPGELETELILRSVPLREKIFDALGVPIVRCGAVLMPRGEDDAQTIEELAANAARNGVDVHIRPDDGALEVPGESLTDPVAFTRALGASARAAGVTILLDSPVVGIDESADALVVHTAAGSSITADAVVNAGGLHADDIARMVGDDTFEIYPRTGEFLVFDQLRAHRLEQILLPVPTKRTKGVLVFPTVDGHVIAGPTAVDHEDKADWSVRPQAREEILAKAVSQYPALAGRDPVASHAGLRPAGRNCNYVIGPSAACGRMVNVAAIRSTGLSASLGIAAYVSDLLAEIGIDLGDELPPTRVTSAPASSGATATTPWWQRTARHVAQHLTH
ncbi:NAD(P)/FAD-dependent oxidoreductase [Gordonia jinhuaensis]|uniref:FAD/NAD(P)-binding oxidoreductase n=1 Tax=Gordonia jinhuaensis TaxID=1517702 RepID=A0A916T638_9ACTN|nr:FAD-dependent oxidoreductase [Gordonia jinhuaensis]GGB33104.1 FAD/NAD(P)-binding oxidoreductase [Gordonia jinhuaensis]